MVYTLTDNAWDLSPRQVINLDSEIRTLTLDPSHHLWVVTNDESFISVFNLIENKFNPLQDFDTSSLQPLSSGMSLFISISYQIDGVGFDASPPEIKLLDHSGDKRHRLATH